MRIAFSPRALRIFLLVFLVLLVGVVLVGCAPIEAPAQDQSSASSAPDLDQAQTPQKEYTDLSAVFIGERMPAFMPDWEQDFDAVARYVDWIGNGSGVPVTLTDLASDTPLSAAALLASVQNDAAMRDAIAAADIVYVGAPTGDMPWVSATDSCDGDTGDRPDWTQYTALCAAAVVEGAKGALNQIYAEVASLRAGEPTVLRTANQINKVIGLFNRNANPGEVTQTLLAPWNEALCAAAEANGFVCADLHKRFNGEDGTQPAEDLLYYANSQMLSDKGSETVASVLIDTGYAELIAAGARAHPFAGQDRWLAAIFDYYGAWPDGNWMTEAWLMRPDGTEAHQIATDVPFPVIRLDWSPDGKSLALGVRLDRTKVWETNRIWQYDIESASTSDLAFCTGRCMADHEPDYSPDGAHIIISRDLDGGDTGALGIGDVASGETIDIVEENPYVGMYDPRWSPDGKSVVFWRSVDNNGLDVDTVNVIKIDGSNESVVTPNDLDAGDPSWSPDGEWIVFSSFPLGQFEEQAVVSNLYRVHPDGTGLEQLTFYETPDIRATTPVYSPDGDWIFFTARERPGMRLWAMPAEGGEPVFIRRGSTLDWRRPALQPLPPGGGE